MKLLLDTHVVVWAIYSPHLLSPRVQALVEDEDNELLFSYASLWELLAKVGRGKLLAAGTSVESVSDRIISLGVTLLRIEVPHILLSAKLPHHHSDPFDRLLIAQALTEKLLLVSSDPILERYGTPVVWN